MGLVTGTISYWCKGCNSFHTVNVFNQDLPHRWKWNGCMYFPSFDPSVRIELPNGYICHHTVVDGMIHYQSDCTHRLANTSVYIGYQKT